MTDDQRTDAVIAARLKEWAALKEWAMNCGHRMDPSKFHGELVVLAREAARRLEARDRDREAWEKYRKDNTGHHFNYNGRDLEAGTGTGWEDEPTDPTDAILGPKEGE